MQIRTIWKGLEKFANPNPNEGFEALASQFEPIKRDSKHSIANSNHSKAIRMQIWTIRKGFECKFESFEKD